MIQHPHPDDKPNQAETDEAAHEEWLDQVCHEAQMVVWSGEFLGQLSEYIKLDLGADEVVDLHRLVQGEIRRILSLATSPTQKDRSDG